MSELYETWRVETGIDLSDPQQASERDSRSGYTQFELFLNSLAEEAALSQTGAAADPAGAESGRFEMGDNFPNPFSGSTRIHFSIRTQGEYRLEVYDTQGRRVESLIDWRELAPGDYEFQWAPDRLASGVYFVRLRSGSDSVVRAMTLLR